MITQKAFDTAYEKIVQMRNEATKKRRHWLQEVKRYNAPIGTSEYNRVFGREQAFSQVLSILEDAEANALVHCSICEREQCRTQRAAEKSILEHGGKEYVPEKENE